MSTPFPTYITLRPTIFFGFGASDFVCFDPTGIPSPFFRAHGQNRTGYYSGCNRVLSPISHVRVIVRSLGDCGELNPVLLGHIQA